MKNKKWKSFLLNEIFTTIQRGKRLTKNKQTPGDVPYISSTMTNNGTDGFIGNETGVRFFQDCLTIANSGSVGSVFYHDYRFIASDHATVLINPKLSKFHYLFLGTCLKMIKEKYSFNREISDKRIKTERITLPVKDDNTPDWDFMEEYIRGKFNQIKDTHKIPEFHEISDERELNDVEWRDFLVKDYFNMAKSRSVTHDELPLISAKKDNNGYKEVIKNPRNQFEKGTITWNKIGDGGAGLAYYHDYTFTMDSINVLALKSDIDISKYSAIFITRLLSQYFGIFRFGNTLSMNRFRRTKFMLPVKNNQPDFDFMEQYMKRIENRVMSRIGKL